MQVWQMNSNGNSWGKKQNIPSKLGEKPIAMVLAHLLTSSRKGKFYLVFSQQEECTLAEVAKVVCGGTIKFNAELMLRAAVMSLQSVDGINQARVTLVHEDLSLTVGESIAQKLMHLAIEIDRNQMLSL